MRLIILFIILSINSFSQVGIGTTSPNSILDINSTSSGILIPRMTETQKNNIVAPEKAELIFQTNNTEGFYFYNGANWERINVGMGGGGSGAFEFNRNLTGIQSSIANNNSIGNHAFSTGSDNNNNADFASVFGDSNQLTSCHYAFTNGLNNTVNSNGRYSVVFGQSNIMNSGYSFVLGRSNNLTNFSSNFVLGHDNLTEGTFTSTFGNDNNISVSSSYSLVFGHDNTLGGNSSYSYIIGENNNLSDSNDCFVFGRNTLMDNTTSRAFSFGQGNRVYGDFGGVLGLGLRKNAYAEVVVGHHATDLAANSRSSYHAQDRTFAVGIGVNWTNRADGFEVFKNGRIYADELDLNEITDNKQLVTKEYVDNLSKVRRVNTLPTTPSLGKILIHGNDGNKLKIFLNGAWHTIVTP